VSCTSRSGEQLVDRTLVWCACPQFLGSQPRQRLTKRPSPQNKRLLARDETFGACVYPPLRATCRTVQTAKWYTPAIQYIRHKHRAGGAAIGGQPLSCGLARVAGHPSNSSLNLGPAVNSSWLSTLLASRGACGAGFLSSLGVSALRKGYGAWWFVVGSRPNRRAL
jgi:hypothetical protein